jgi:hypothetical protein
MISLSDRQLALVMDAAAELPIEKRALLLERIGGFGSSAASTTAISNSPCASVYTT